jgi:hypothetical protein
MSGGQALAALGATMRKDQAAILCCHPRPEAMTAFTDQTTGLKCAFHVILQHRQKFKARCIDARQSQVNCVRQ